MEATSGDTSSISTHWWTSQLDRLHSWAERHRFTAFLLRLEKCFQEIEGKHLALVIATNLFVAIIPLIIIGFALIEGFNPHRTIGTVIVENFHLTGSTADTVRNTFASASSGRNVALSISVISLLITGFDISATVQLAYARAFKVVPLKGVPKYLRGATWLVLMLTVLGMTLTLRYLIATRASWFVAIALPTLLLINFLFFLVSPRILLDLPFVWRDLVPGAAICTVFSAGVSAVVAFELHRWLEQYTQAYGAFGVALALVAGVAIIATFWVWIAAVMGTYWEGKVGHAVSEKMKELSAEMAK
jgi:membrane protein